MISDLAGEAAQKGWLPPFQLIGEAEQWHLARLFKEANGLQGLLEAAFRSDLTDNSGERRGLEKQLREAFLRVLGNRRDGTSALFLESRCYRWKSAQKRLKACVERYHQKIKELGFLDYDGLRQRSETENTTRRKALTARGVR